MEVTLTILNILVITIATYLSAVSSLHMFQLNSYQIKSHINRIKESPVQLLPNAIIFALSLLSFALPEKITYIYIDVLFIIAIYLNRPKKAKKPFVYTPRIKRQLTTISILYIAILICGLIFKNPVFAVCIFFFLIPLIIIKSAIINKPIEKSINNGFINDAKKILQSMESMKIIGVTGSYGKTSVKYYINTLLKAQYNVLMTPGSFNTPMGVVRTIREYLKPTHEIFVCEMGARHVGDIKEICDIVHPHDGIITSIGPQHLETFYTLDNIKKTKFELADACEKNGLLFLNLDDENIVSCLDEKKYIGYGINNKSGYYAKDIKISEKGTEFAIVTPSGEECIYNTRLIGSHNVLNIVGAIAVANTYGIPLEKLRPQVRKLECVPHRLEMKDHGNVTIIDDAYNANPSGTKAALDVFGVFDGYKILITPGMVELGEKQNDYNYEFGVNAANVCDFIILVGQKQTESIYNGLINSGFDKEKIYITHKVEDGINFAYSIDTQGKKKYILLENDLPDNY